MRIGEFSSRFRLPASTVRYYIENGLLVPLKANGQYRFSESDAQELQIISKLKKLSFTLPEIRHVLQAYRMYNSDDYRLGNVLTQLYAEKHSSLKKHISQATASLRGIEAEMNELSGNVVAAARQPCGMPLVGTNIIVCPQCGKSPTWDHVTLHNNQIYGGALDCTCGYRAHVEDGILITDDDISFYMSEQFMIEHYQSIPRDEEDFVYFEYMNHISERTTTMLLKSYAWMHAILSELKTPPKVIILPDLSAHYLYKYIDAPYFRDALIIVSGFSKHNISAIKSHFDAMEHNSNILYIANTIYQLPIQKGIADLWIDAIASYNFSFFHQRNALHQLLAPYFAQNATVVGLTKYLEPRAQSLQNIKKLYSRSHPENSLLSSFRRILQDSGWEQMDNAVHGYVIEPGEYYEYVHPGDKHWYYGYSAKKAPR